MIEQARLWVDETKKDLIENYTRLGLRASGKWANELDDEIAEKDNVLHIKIKGADYTYQLENGRTPNRDQSKESLKAWVGWAGSTFLKQWVSDKGINISPFAVAWKIAREGVRVPNTYNKGGLVSDVITNEKVNELVNSIGIATLASLKSDVINELK